MFRLTTSNLRRHTAMTDKVDDSVYELVRDALDIKTMGYPISADPLIRQTIYEEAWLSDEDIDVNELNYYLEKVWRNQYSLSILVKFQLPGMSDETHCFKFKGGSTVATMLSTCFDGIGVGCVVSPSCKYGTPETEICKSYDLLCSNIIYVVRPVVTQSEKTKTFATPRSWYDALNTPLRCRSAAALTHYWICSFHNIESNPAIETWNGEQDNNELNLLIFNDLINLDQKINCYKKLREIGPNTFKFFKQLIEVFKRDYPNPCEEIEAFIRTMEG